MKVNSKTIQWTAYMSVLALLCGCAGEDLTDVNSSSAFSSSSSSIVFSSTSSSSSSSPVPVPPVSSSSQVASSSSTPPQTAEPPIAEPVSSAVNKSVVRFIYFIEKGETYDQRRYDGLVEAAFDLQQYWYEQFGGTFYLYDNVVDVMYGDQTSDWYVNTPDGFGEQRWYRLNNMKKEVFGKLNMRDFDSRVRTITYPSDRVDGRVAENYGGAWMDGDDMGCFAGENGGVTFPFDEEYFAHCLGQTAHEFGHAYGLGHQGPDDDCMQFGFYDYETHGAMCQFSAANRAQVKSDSSNQSFLAALPGQVINKQGFVESR